MVMAMNITKQYALQVVKQTESHNAKMNKLCDDLLNKYTNDFILLILKMK